MLSHEFYRLIIPRALELITAGFRNLPRFTTCKFRTFLQVCFEKVKAELHELLQVSQYVLEF